MPRTSANSFGLLSEQNSTYSIGYSVTSASTNMKR